MVENLGLSAGPQAGQCTQRVVRSRRDGGDAYAARTAVLSFTPCDGGAAKSCANPFAGAESIRALAPKSGRLGAMACTMTAKAADTKCIQAMSGREPEDDEGTCAT